jgi:WD repeat-containing protein 19
MLMRNEYRNQVDKKYRKPIEAFVRRPIQEEPDEKLSSCPYCSFDIPETLLDCPSCKNSLPYCITTGKHMLVHDWTCCPSCHFPSLYTTFVERINAEQKCAMCNQIVQLSAINKINDPRAELMKNEEDGQQPKQNTNTNTTNGIPQKIDAVDIKVNL